MSITLYDLPALRDCFFCNLLCIGGVYFVLFVLVSLIMMWMQALNPRRSLKLCFPRIGRLAVFLIVLLVVGDIFSFLWGATIFDHLYYSMDYAGIDFLPWFPVTQGLIDSTWGDKHGALMGVTIWELQIIWLVFAACTWGATILLYRKILQFARLFSGINPIPSKHAISH